MAAGLHHCGIFANHHQGAGIIEMLCVSSMPLIFDNLEHRLEFVDAEHQLTSGLLCWAPLERQPTAPAVNFIFLPCLHHNVMNVVTNST